MVKQTQANENFVFKATDKFKDITIVLRRMFSISKQNTTLVALLMYMLEDRNEKFPTKKEMLSIKDHLYGTTFSSGVVGYGKNMVLQIASKVMDPQFADDSKLLEKHSEWFVNMTHYPLLNQETFLEAKAQVRSSLIRDLDQPSKLAQIKAFEALGEDSVIAINLDGDLNTLEETTLQDVQKFFKDVYLQAHTSVYVIGNITKEDAKALYYDTLNIKEHFYPFECEALAKEKIEDVVESKDTTQTQLIKLLKTNVSMDHPLYLANRLAVAILGQLPTSYLFVEIREKRSLCYSIYSQYIAFDGLCLIKTGIDTSNIDEVKELINQQVGALLDIDEDLLYQAKTMIINAIKNAEDELLSYVNLHYSYALIQQPFSSEQLIKDIQQVSKLDVVQAVSLWEELLTYVLKGEQA